MGLSKDLGPKNEIEALLVNLLLLLLLLVPSSVLSSSTWCD